MDEQGEVPAWVDTLHARYARGTEPPPPAAGTGSYALVARGSSPILRGPDDVTDVNPIVDPAAHEVTEVMSLPPEHRTDRRRLIAKVLYLISFAAVVVTITVASVRMLQRPHVTPKPVPAAVAIAGDARLELAPDRRAIVRVGPNGAPLWTAPQPAPLDGLELTAGLVLGRTSAGMVGVDLASGAPRVQLALAAGERWGVQPPAVLGGCLIATTIHGDDALVHCLDLARGAPRWDAKLAGGRECARPIALVAGAYLASCPGWTAILDERTGAVTFDAGGVGLVQREPPLLLRVGVRPMLAEWQPAARRFALRGPFVRAPDDVTSAAMHGGRLVARASSATDKLAYITSRALLPTASLPVPVTAPELQLADDAPLVLDCDGGGSPRYQLLELAPRAGATFDPAAAQQRVLALLDTESGRLAWTSKKLVPPRRLGAPTQAICRHGHYFVPVDLADASSAVWIVDAETGSTAAGFALGRDTGASFAELRADQIDRDRIVGVGFELAWRSPVTAAGVRDARPELERLLGRLP